MKGKMPMKEKDHAEENMMERKKMMMGQPEMSKMEKEHMGNGKGQKGKKKKAKR